MKTKLFTFYFLLSTFYFLLSPSSSSAQGVAININGTSPHTSAMLDVSSEEKGILIPTLTTTQRDAIASPALSLLIFNTTTNCFEFYKDGAWHALGCACVNPPAQPSAIAGNNTPCENQTGLTYSVTYVPGVVYTWTVPTGWSITAGQSTYSITVTAGTSSGDITVTPSNACGNGTAQDLAITINTVPAAPIEGTHVPDETEIEWNWNTVSGATGYKWNTTNDYGTAIDKGTSTSHTETSLTCNTAYTRYVWAYNDCGESVSSTTLTASTSACPTFVCGTSTVTFTYKGSSVTYGTVEKDYGSGNVKCWLDRNLGATQVATSSTDAASYGDLFQWGRRDDGHQTRTSGTTTTLATTDTPGHANFILAPNSPFDWRSPQNTGLWQGVSGTNNPCPTGWRVPTDAEWTTERLSWSAQNAAGALASPLKLPLAGYRRNDDNGSLLNVNTEGIYWSSTVSTIYSRGLSFSSSMAGQSTGFRAHGRSVRCIKD